MAFKYNMVLLIWVFGVSGSGSNRAKVIRFMDNSKL